LDRKNNSGDNTYNQTASSFMNSNEFYELYFSAESNEEYIYLLYSNILDREPDTNGQKYWINQIQGGYENKNDVLIGFAESKESKDIFIGETSLTI
tara:strand:+ start:216 stop:503 length:288 start_codon:yes stop_codon:yes gene_type:complete